MEISVSLIRQLDQVDPDLRNILFAILEEFERQSKERVTKDEFRELRQTVHELAQAQARTEARIDELAQAQAKTEARLDSLVQRVDELAQAQARTEARLDSLVQRVDELAQAQAKTEARIDELAQAQAKTEAEVRKLAMSHRELKTQVAGLSDSVGYGLEDRLMPYIPEYARLEFGLEVESLDRKNVIYPDGRYDEVNILARGSLNGETACLVGECKAKPGKKDADRFASLLERLSTVLEGRLIPVLIGYTFAPEVERHVSRKHPHIRLVKTYALEMRARGDRKASV
ncbi:hypothetical protein Dthio_PD3357 [Desulfonatronospira thiodismutans ASO3-1]|uniref:Chordopoxvirus fusion protein n=1 Tax=Desulfonatronospira thiodismutans ASO3-1 TaxID=555779 RepID=D6SMK5_9BACT|nr:MULTISPECIES: hypothetical protein [Desulfonatronospira]EFI35916.1 hypothetical protein Dthio_PD3357 [Desulfonatronospira thiodismutans ASO3-1]RQD73616.1 MAG: hypothetical protein D5S03_12330 [Desulfonatronospira sp. MSAO_Bac3]